MILKDKLTSEPGFEFVLDCLELMSATGRRRLLQQPWLTEVAALELEYDNIAQVVALLQNTEYDRQVAVVRHQLMQMHDLQGTLLSLQNGITIEEIELFEIKCFAFLCMETNKAAATMGIAQLLDIPDMTEVFSLLDPDKTGIANFYIYDSYHPDLPEIRRKLKAIQTLLENQPVESPDRIKLQEDFNQTFEQQGSIEQKVISQLSQKLHTQYQLLQKAIDQMAYTDLLFAKATLALMWNLTRPAVGNTTEAYLAAIWNPRLKQRTEQNGLRYQPVDIDLQSGTCLITGANMAGKTVLLKTVGIIQMMAQFGFYVPASEARLSLVDDVIFCIGDEQNEMNGLSSFASEIIKISDCVTRAQHGRYLILIDEPARTTNPVEGKAIVQSLATLLGSCESTTLITTHYSQLGLQCRRLRVKGFVEGLADIPLSPDNINRFMDYSLVPDNSDEVPQEALRIASILNCNTELLSTAQQFLVKNN